MIGLIATVVVGLVFYFLWKPNIPRTDMSPANLDSFTVTQAKEGSVIPWIAGRVRIPGNIIYYGNLVTEAIMSEGSSGGKGGGGGDPQTTGYKYYLDVWQSIALGKISIIKMWINDKEGTPDATVEFNDGTQSTYPTEPGSNANKLKGVAHQFLKSWFLGDNTTYVPTIHYLAESDYSGHPVSNAIMTNGINPAAICYQIFLDAGVPSYDMSLAKFNTAAAYWYNKGYGLNLAISRQAKVKTHIGHILSYVGGVFGRDENDLIFIKAFDPTESASYTIDAEEDFIKWTFYRKGWADTDNAFTGKFIDEDQEYTERVVRCYNSANIRIQNKVKPKSVDLTAFRTETIASQRLWEIMKHESYPGAQITGETNLKYSRMLVGDVVAITSSEYGITDAEFRVIDKDISEVDSNIVKFKFIQMVERLFDSNYQSGGESEWTNPDYTPSPLVYQKVFELPYNPVTMRARGFLMLGARVHSFETGFLVRTSPSGTDYETSANLTTWAQYGTLDATYPIDTLEIDDDIGILFTPYRDDPEFGTIDRTTLFSKARYALVDSEIMKFQSYTPEGSTQVRLLGVCRGIMNTTIAVHNSATPIWLFNLDNNIMTGITSDNFYTKFLPYFGSKTVEESAASTTYTTIADTAKQPWPVLRIEAVRSGSTVDITWYPVNQDNLSAGAGASSPTAQTDQTPFLYDQDFESYYASTYEVETGTTRQIDNAASFGFQIRARYNGNVSAFVTVSVGAADGIYISD